MDSHEAFNPLTQDRRHPGNPIDFPASVLAAGFAAFGALTAACGYLLWGHVSLGVLLFIVFVIAALCAAMTVFFGNRRLVELRRLAEIEYRASVEAETQRKLAEMRAKENTSAKP